MTKQSYGRQVKQAVLAAMALAGLAAFPAHAQPMPENTVDGGMKLDGGPPDAHLDVPPPPPPHPHHHHKPGTLPPGAAPLPPEDETAPRVGSSNGPPPGDNGGPLPGDRMGGNEMPPPGGGGVPRLNGEGDK